jgi:hypothetical protein
MLPMLQWLIRIHDGFQSPLVFLASNLGASNMLLNLRISSLIPLCVCVCVCTRVILVDKSSKMAALNFHVAHAPMAHSHS